VSKEETLSTADLADRKEEEEEDLNPQQQAEEERAEEEQVEEEQADESGEDTLEPLLPAEGSERYQQRWNELQSSFVDEPRGTVEEADGLVAELMQELAKSFSDTRSSLEDQWTRGDDVSTEDLRVALQRYRSFFERLLSA
jgi:glutathione S-transferase